MRFIIHRSRDGLWFFIIRSRNGRTLAHSETYKSERACRRAIAVIASGARYAPIVEAADSG